jgi:hypothetical protein
MPRYCPEGLGVAEETESTGGVQRAGYKLVSTMSPIPQTVLGRVELSLCGLAMR